MQANLEYNPKKKNRVLKIIAQIISTLFTALMLITLITGDWLSGPQCVPFEDVNLYHTNPDDVYELKNLRVLSKYTSDEYVDYYLVLLPYKDEKVKVASFSCVRDLDFNINLRKQLDDKKENSENCVMDAGVTIDTADYLYYDVKDAYDQSVENLYNNGVSVVSTDLSFDYVCDANSKAFAEYQQNQKADNCFLFGVFAFLSALGIVFMFFSFREKEYGNQIYFVPPVSQNTALDYDFDSRF